MNTFLIFLAFLSVPSFAKWVWKKDENMIKKVGEAMKGTEYDVYGNTTVIELRTSELTITGSNKMVALCQSTTKPDSKSFFFYLPMVVDEEGNTNFVGGIDGFDDRYSTRLFAEQYVYSRFAFKFVWQHTLHYYKLLEKSPPQTLAHADEDFAYEIPGLAVVMTYKTEDGRFGAIHAQNKNHFLFTVRLRDEINGPYNVIHTSEGHDWLYDVQRELCKYLQAPVQWAEPWQVDSKDLLQVFPEDTSVKLVSQLESRIGMSGLTMEKAKRVRGDSLKIAAVFRQAYPSMPILAIVTAPSESGKDFNFNYIYAPKKLKDGGDMEKHLQEYISQQPFPLTNNWEIVTEKNNEVEEMLKIVKEDVLMTYNVVESCGAYKTRNVGSTYKQKAAIVYIEAGETSEVLQGLHAYVAWSENDGKLLIKHIGKIVFTAKDAECDFNFYGISPLAYTESEFKDGVGWYGEAPKFIEAAMPTIMVAVREVMSTTAGGYDFEAGYELQEAGRIPTTKLSEGDHYFRLKVKRNQNPEVETVDVKFTNEEFIKIWV